MTASTSTDGTPVPTRPTLEGELAAVMVHLRGAVLDALAEAGADPTHPRDAARSLGLDKSLAWKLCRIAQASDALDGAALVPGAAGLRIARAALAKAGCSADSLASLDAAVEAFDRVVHVHTGDRRTLDLIVTNLGTSDPHRREQQRRLSFEGNSATWGVQARAQITATIARVNADDATRADLVRLGGVIDFRRLRAGTQWLLFRRYDRHDDGTATSPRWTAIDERHDAIDRLPIIEAFSTHPLPEFECIRGDGEYCFELVPGPIGNTASITCMYGAIARAMFPVHRDETNSKLDIATNLMTPVEVAIADVLVHDSFHWVGTPAPQVISLLHSGDVHAAARRPHSTLPVDAELVELGRGLPAAASPHVPGYRQMLGSVFERLGWNPAEFRVLRMVVTYPPIPAAAIVSFELPGT